MSTIIKVRCIDQVLTFENTPVVASGGLEEDRVQFYFCDKWDGYAKTAVFWLQEAEAYHAVLELDDSCAIPVEVLTGPGVMYFGVFGVDPSGRRRTTEVLRYTITKGVITDGTAPSDPTQEIYTQLLAKYAEVGPVVAEAAAQAKTAAEQTAESAQICQQMGEQMEAHAARHAIGGEDPLTPKDIGAEPADESLTRYVGDRLLTGDGTEVEIRDPFRWYTVFLVPFTYPNVTSFDSPGGIGTFQYVEVDLPAEINLDEFCYEFQVAVYGLQRYGDTGVNTVNATVYLADAQGSRSNETALFSLYRTTADPLAHIVYPYACTYFVKTMPAHPGISWAQGYKAGELVFDPEGGGYRGSSYVYTGKYPKLVLGFQCGQSGAFPVETCGIKLEYRAYLKKEV